LNKMRSIPDMITGLRALANSPEALISHAALLNDSANYIEGATDSLREHMGQLIEMRVKLEQTRTLMEQAATELEELYDIYRANQHQRDRDMELPRAIKSMLRWWGPGK
jgi:hypothetical protein